MHAANGTSVNSHTGKIAVPNTRLLVSARGRTLIW
jgi:hypothetical protein